MDVACQYISERLWKCLVGRYGCYFEEDIMRLMMTTYHAKGLDASEKFAPTPTRRAMHGTKEASKIWVVEVPTIEYSH